MKSLWVLPVLACVFGCPAEEASPSIEGATPQEAAQEVAGVSCERFAACGTISASCVPCSIDAGEDCAPTCTVEAVPTTAQACIDGVVDDLERGFACEELTDEEVALVDECLAAIPDAPCPTVEEVEAWVDGGRQGRDPRDPIEACDLIRDDILYRCEQGE